MEKPKKSSSLRLTQNRIILWKPYHGDMYPTPLSVGKHANLPDELINWLVENNFGERLEDSISPEE